ncbi:MAG: site-2 protease family protein [Thermoplasmata archaeon]
MSWITILILIFLFWFLILIYISKLKSNRIKPYGPAIMLSTTKGKRSIEKWGRKKFWSSYGEISIILVLIFMFLTLILLFWEAILVIGIPKSQAPSPLVAIGLPGINPFIPITYGIMAIVVAVVVHELSHGLLSANRNVGIKSMGVLLFILPIGAFVEPDEEKLSKLNKHDRMKVFSSGPSTNIIYAFVFLIIFLLMLSTVSSTTQGALITYSGNKLIQPGDVIVSIDNFNITNSGAINNIGIDPGKNVTVKILRGDSIFNVNTISGVWINSVLPNSPASQAGIKPGEIIFSIDGKIVKNSTFFNSFMDNTSAGQVINLTLLENGKLIHFNITLMDKYKFYQNYAPNYNSENYKGKGFLGVSSIYMNVSFTDPSRLLSTISNPFSGGIFSGMITLITLPFIGLSPVPSYFQYIYSVPFSPLFFWSIVNIVYWIFWINLMLGLTNVLPLLPLDGGYVIKDILSISLEKWKVLNHEKIASGISIALSFIVLFLILWQFIYPRIF